MTDLRALAARLEAATGPDRGLGHDIAEAFGTAAGHMTGEFDGCTESLDAITALVDRTLPGWTWGINGADPELDNVCVSELWRGDPNRAPMDRAYAEAPTSALALCLALVRAKIAQEEAE